MLETAAQRKARGTQGILGALAKVNDEIADNARKRQVAMTEFERLRDNGGKPNAPVARPVEARSYASKPPPSNEKTVRPSVVHRNGRLAPGTHVIEGSDGRMYRVQVDWNGRVVKAEPEK